MRHPIGVSEGLSAARMTDAILAAFNRRSLPEFTFPKAKKCQKFTFPKANFCIFAHWTKSNIMTNNDYQQIENLFLEKISKIDTRFVR
ncbi:MAG: hypothetical protein K6C07_02610, partial [Bacteroidales bacterium]|nr:hypothetical protein [Bacteroidales bacterium]